MMLLPKQDLSKDTTTRQSSADGEILCVSIHRQNTIDNYELL